MKSKVLIGMSGGIDSSVAALLLIEEGYTVEGLYLQNGFPAHAEDDAARIARLLYIPFSVKDVRLDFDQNIIDYFVSAYSAGETPNPCIVCNKRIKFRYLLEEARSRDIDHIATGHYARVEKAEEGYHLRRGVDRGKDQSYFLYQLGQEELSRIIFPNGNRVKKTVQAIGRDRGLTAGTKNESQEICFVNDNDYRPFVEKRMPRGFFSPGSIITEDGTRVGTHRGIHSVTIGQRRGLNIASERPYYVIGIDGARNEVIVGRAEEQYCESCVVANLSWTVARYGKEDSFRARVYIRYRHRGVGAVVNRHPGDISSRMVTFDAPQKAVAPGQAAVFYRDDTVIGGGWITHGVRHAP